MTLAGLLTSPNVLVPRPTTTLSPKDYKSSYNKTQFVSFHLPLFLSVVKVVTMSDYYLKYFRPHYRLLYLLTGLSSWKNYLFLGTLIPVTLVTFCGVNYLPYTVNK